MKQRAIDVDGIREVVAAITAAIGDPQAQDEQADVLIAMAHLVARYLAPKSDAIVLSYIDKLMWEIDEERRKGETH